MAKSRRPRVPMSEQIRIINECRRSGLSDKEYCEQHDIPIATFYSWIKRAQTLGSAQILEPTYGHKTAPAVQEVVSVDIIPEKPMVPTVPVAAPDVYLDNSHAIEVSMNDITIRIQNHADPRVLAQTLKLLKEFSC